MAQKSVGDELDRIELALSFQLGQAHGASNRHFAQIAAALGLTLKQVCALWLIADHPGLSQIDLGHKLHMDRATTMGVVNRLQSRGLVRRERSTSDGRKQALYLEPSSEPVLAEARQVTRDHETWLASRFTATERDTLIDLLGRLHQ